MENNMAKRILNEEDTVSVVCDLYLAGHTEDFQEYHAECYYIVIQRLDGHRISHFMVFDGAIRHEDADCGYVGFQDVRKEAKAKADDLVARIMQAGVVDLDHWRECEPAYGSAYYCICNGF